ncbi:MAG: regulatory protein RecX [Prevotellaceae bacterium]|nr:regulatory protein RecX [Prevotellaceae bacterium]
MTEEQVLNKLTTLCAKGEHCQQEMLDKMRKWEIEEDVQARVMEYLLKEKFIDEERYTRLFVEEKIKFNKWGRKKLEQALYMKRIPRSIYAPILDEVDDDNYEEILRPLLEAKRKSVTGKSEYEIRGKLIRFALSRGFDMDTILSVLD